jgi:hypothetical protein
MTDAISTIRATAPTTDTQVSAAAATSSSSTQSVSIGSSSSQNVASTISPRLVYNPVAGVVVTEFLNNSGQIDVQLPSKAAIAYLQAGLTQQGDPRPADGSIGASA